jgi:hypothetical protein
MKEKMTETISIKLGKTMKEKLRALPNLTAARCRATSPSCWRTIWRNAPRSRRSVGDSAYHANRPHYLFRSGFEIVTRVARVLEAAGVMFIAGNGHGPGVIRRRSRPVRSRVSLA